MKRVQKLAYTRLLVRIFEFFFNEKIKIRMHKNVENRTITLPKISGINSPYSSVNVLIFHLYFNWHISFIMLC